MKYLLLLPALVLCGCSNLPRVARELKGDSATVVVNVNTIYGTARLVRTNPGTNHTAIISPDGTVTVKRE